MANKEIVSQRARLITQARFLIPRLEKMSPDSTWAHRASGARIALLRMVDRIEMERVSPDGQVFSSTSDLNYLRALIERGYELLERAAREMLG